VAALTGGLVFISERTKPRCALVHCAFRGSFQSVVSHLTSSPAVYPIRRESDLARGAANRLSCIGHRRRRGWSLRSSHRQFIGHRPRQFLWRWRFTGLPHRRRHLWPRTARRALLRWLRRSSRLDRRILLRIDRHFAASGISVRCLNGEVAVMFRSSGAVARADSLHAAGAWHTASMLWPSGSSTKAP
jgi:hypothetical protein